MFCVNCDQAGLFWDDLTHETDNSVTVTYGAGTSVTFGGEPRSSEADTQLLWQASSQNPMRQRHPPR